MARKTRKIKDKWKEKKWVSVKAPDSFNNITIGYVPITDDEKAKGRVIEVTLFDILKGDPSQHQYKIYFQIVDVKDEKATTIFKRYEYAKEFLRSLVRRGSSKVNFIIVYSPISGSTSPNVSCWPTGLPSLGHQPTG